MVRNILLFMLLLLSLFAFSGCDDFLELEDAEDSDDDDESDEDEDSDDESDESEDSDEEGTGANLPNLES